MKTRLWIFSAVALVSAGWLFLAPGSDDVSPLQALKRTLQMDNAPLPDFSQHTDVRAKKQAFFDYLQPIVAANNQRVLDDRARLRTLADTSDEALSGSDRRFLQQLVNRYEVDAAASSEAQRAELLVRLDTVPMSLALSQAAMESAWGTSRFAREGNNLFGQWCYKAGCGIVPKRRGKVRCTRWRVLRVLMPPSRLICATSTAIALTPSCAQLERRYGQRISRSPATPWPITCCAIPSEAWIT